MGEEKQIYMIRIKGKINLNWLTCIDEVSIEYSDQDQTILNIAFPDQTALHGVLMRIRDLGLTLLEVKRIENSLKRN